MDSSRNKSSNKISDIVRLQRMLKKWKKLAKNSGGGGGGSTGSATSAANSSSFVSSNSSNSTSDGGSGSGSGSGSKTIKFLKRTLSFTDFTGAAAASGDGGAVPPKGFLAVCVGSELKRFIIPTEYLRHQAFEILLQEAEEEFGFQQEGVLKIPCEVAVFEKILKAVEEKKDVFFVQHDNVVDYGGGDAGVGYCSSSSDCELTPSSHHHAQMMCR